MRWVAAGTAALFGGLALVAVDHPGIAVLWVATVALALRFTVHPGRTPAPVPALTPVDDDVSDDVRERVYARDGMKCRYFCGRTLHRMCGEGRGPLGLCPTCATLDHVHPRSQGGSNDPANLVTCCWEENDAKGPRTVEQWAAAGYPGVPPRW